MSAVRKLCYTIETVQKRSGEEYQRNGSIGPHGFGKNKSLGWLPCSTTDFMFLDFSLYSFSIIRLFTELNEFEKKLMVLKLQSVQSSFSDRKFSEFILVDNTKSRGCKIFNHVI